MGVVKQQLAYYLLCHVPQKNTASLLAIPLAKDSQTTLGFFVQSFKVYKKPTFRLETAVTTAFIED